MLVAVFEWSDGYVKTVGYPKKVRGLIRNGERPTRLQVLVREAKPFDAKMSEWFNYCYAALHKGE